jgi:hypothetical protein
MEIERACASAYEAGMTEPTEISPVVLANSVLGLLMRSGRPRSDGLGRTMEVEQERGEAMTFTMLASNLLDADHVARVRVWLADVELDRDRDNHVVNAFHEAPWAGVLLAALIIDEDAARAPRHDRRS